MKISKLELVVLLLVAGFLAFCAGWLLRGSNSSPPMRIETERTLEQDETLVLPAPTPSPSLSDGEKININTADMDELMRLPGIGEKRAADIIAYRETYGPFRIPEELADVSGIGEGTLANLMDYITVS